MSYISELQFALQRAFPEGLLVCSDAKLEGTVTNQGRSIHLSTDEQTLAVMADAEASYLAHIAPNAPAAGLANLISIHCEEAMLTLEQVEIEQTATELQIFNPATGEVFPPRHESAHKRRRA